VAAYYLDSSAVVKRYVRELGSTWVRSLMARAAGHNLILARITGVEVVAALIRHSPPLPPPDLARALARFQRHFQNRFQLIPINRNLIAQAMLLAVRHRLRGYDAVQLASALEARARQAARGQPAPVFVSADANLNAAATTESLAVDDPTTHP
jgi:predicted nucleic acid-binding protein